MISGSNPDCSSSEKSLNQKLRQYSSKKSIAWDKVDPNNCTEHYSDKIDQEKSILLFHSYEDIVIDLLDKAKHKYNPQERKHLIGSSVNGIGSASEEFTWGDE